MTDRTIMLRRKVFPTARTPCVVPGIAVAIATRVESIRSGGKKALGTHHMH